MTLSRYDDDDDDDDDDNNIKVMAKMFINAMMAKMMTMTNLIHVKSEVLETMRLMI